jgi:hypothetical protein
MAVKLDPELTATDALLDAWSRDGKFGIGGGMHPLEVMRLLHEGEALSPQLSNDEVMIIVDQTVLRSPPRVKAFVTNWYKSNAPAQVKAHRLGISRSALYVEWKAVLWFMRGCFRSKGISV